MAVPLAVLTVILPVVAPVGTGTTIFVAMSLVIVAAVPWKVTLVAPDRPVPLIVTLVPAGPELGLKLVMAGARTVSLAARAWGVARAVCVVTYGLAVARRGARQAREDDEWGASVSVC